MPPEVLSEPEARRVRLRFWGPDSEPADKPVDKTRHRLTEDTMSEDGPQATQQYSCADDGLEFCCSSDEALLSLAMPSLPRDEALLSLAMPSLPRDEAPAAHAAGATTTCTTAGAAAPPAAANASAVPVR